MNSAIIPFDKHYYFVLPFVHGLRNHVISGNHPSCGVSFFHHIMVGVQGYKSGNTSNNFAFSYYKVLSSCHLIIKLCGLLLTSKKGRNKMTKNQTATTVATFNFQDNQVRTLTVDDKIYFCAKDVAKALGYSRPNDAIERHTRGSVFHGVIDSLGRKQQVKFIPEPDVYRLAIKSKLPSAEKFEKWVFEEVLPSIRKTGSYSVEEKEVEYAFPMELAFEFIHLGSTTLDNNISHSIKRIRKELVELEILMVEHMDNTSHAVHHLRPYRFTKVAKNHQSIGNQCKKR